MSTPNLEKTLTNKETFVFKDLVGPHFNPNWHFHPEYQISYIAQGKGTRFVGDHVQSFTAGDLVMTGPNLPHLWRSDAEYFMKGRNLTTRGLVIYFDEQLVSESLMDREEFYGLKKLISNASRGIEFFGETQIKIRNLLMSIDAERGFKRILRLLEILDLLATSEEYNLLASPGYSNMLKGEDAEKMRLIYDYVMKNFKTKISLETVANLVNMTTTSFCRYFKPRMNKTFVTFVNEIRIGHARKLLLEDNLNISQISYECGYNTISNFNKQFKAIARMSPLEYRKLFLKITSSLS